MSDIRYDHFTVFKEFQTSEDMKYGKKLRNHKGEGDERRSYKEVPREDLSHIPERSREDCLEEVALNMDFLR